MKIKSIRKKKSFIKRISENKLFSIIGSGFVLLVLGLLGYLQSMNSDYYATNIYGTNIFGISMLILLFGFLFILIGIIKLIMKLR